ncbi:MAG: TIGR03936 family radical SAM-associated protein [Oscillospiraceae bacterium]|nr:TIGR03936 family radical SAM-associated protein [Oscillospiraceae bacterium]
MNFTNIRVFFSKTGNAKYISHLDLYRAMGRAVKRSKLPVWITEGFNPHIYMTFALPLALGIESAEESVDLRLTSEIDAERVAESLNSVMPCGLDVIRVSAPLRKASEIQKARYKITAPAETMREIDEFFARPVIEITKKTKKNTQVIDVKPLICWETEYLTLPAGSTLNINPWNVLSFDSINVKRVGILCDDGRVFA